MRKWKHCFGCFCKINESFHLLVCNNREVSLRNMWLMLDPTPIINQSQARLVQSTFTEYTIYSQIQLSPDFTSSKYPTLYWLRGSRSTTFNIYIIQWEELILISGLWVSLHESILNFWLKLKVPLLETTYRSINLSDSFPVSCDITQHINLNNTLFLHS